MLRSSEGAVARSDSSATIKHSRAGSLAHAPDFEKGDGAIADDADEEAQQQPLLVRRNQSIELEPMTITNPGSWPSPSPSPTTPRETWYSGSPGGTGRPSSSRCTKYFQYAAIALVLVALLVAVKQLLANPALIQAVLTGAQEHPAIVVPLFILANISAPLMLLPSGPFQLLAGAIWGLPLGFIISGSATLVANLSAFTVGRHLLQQRLSSYMTKNIPSFPAIQAAILAEGWRLVLMLRLSPVLPDSLMNYALSLTNISFKVFAAATAVAMVPWSMLYCYLGSASKDIVATLSGGGQSEGGGGMGWVNIAVLIVSLVSGAGAVVYLGQVIKKAIAKAAAAGAGRPGGERERGRDGLM